MSAATETTTAVQGSTQTEQDAAEQERLWRAYQEQLRRQQGCYG